MVKLTSTQQRMLSRIADQGGVSVRLPGVTISNGTIQALERRGLIDVGMAGIWFSAVCTLTEVVRALASKDAS